MNRLLSALTFASGLAFAGCADEPPLPLQQVATLEARLTVPFEAPVRVEVFRDGDRVSDRLFVASAASRPTPRAGPSPQPELPDETPEPEAGVTPEPPLDTLTFALPPGDYTIVATVLDTDAEVPDPNCLVAEAEVSLEVDTHTDIALAPDCGGVPLATVAQALVAPPPVFPGQVFIAARARP